MKSELSSAAPVRADERVVAGAFYPDLPTAPAGSLGLIRLPASALRSCPLTSSPLKTGQLLLVN
jgi:hypothetical protein